MSAPAPTIVGLGGGGLLHAGDRALLAPELARLAGVAPGTRPRACFLPTAVGDDALRELAFHEACAELGWQPSVLRLFVRDVDDPAALLAAQDVVWVSGGNTASALAVWRVHGVDAALRAAHAAGVVLAGSSAGFLCWFEACVTDSFQLETSAPLADGLGLLPGSACPHYDSEPTRRPAYTRLVAEGFPAGVAATDGAALVYRGRELAEVLALRPGAGAVRVELPAGATAAVETPLPARRLG